INSDTFETWKQNFLRTLEYNYKKAPFYNKVIKLLSDILTNNYCSISKMATQSIYLTCDYLNIECQFNISGELNIGNDLSGTERILEICLEVGATKYINPIGGVDLYSKDTFIQHGVDLSFIKSGDVVYKQFSNEFVPWLSIIDVLMFNSPRSISEMLDNYELI
ncbi:MAG TPA: WbqC family protein, partial [Tissierellaceae bacterium]